MSTCSRRRCLKLIAGSTSIGLAGCLSRRRSAAQPTPEYGPDGRPGDRSYPTVPMLAYTAANTGYAPGVAGPTSTVTEQWTLDIGGRGVDYAAPILANGLVYYTAGSAVYGISAVDGTIQWRTRLDDSTWGSLATDGESLYLVTSESVAYGLDADSGSIQWEAELGDFSSPTITSPTIVEDTLYLVSSSPAVHALAASDGSEQWTYQTEGGVNHKPAVDSGAVHVATNRGDIITLASGDGSEVWRNEITGSAVGNPAVSDDRLYVSGDISLSAFATDSGERLWNRSAAADDPTTSPAVAENVVCTGMSGFSCYDSTSGTLAWDHPHTDMFSSSPVITDDTVYSATNFGELVAFDRADGQVRWRYDLGDGILTSSPTVAGNTVFISSQNGTLHALTE